MITIYDSTNPNDIPENVQGVAGYLDLWAPDAWSMFRQAAVKLYIARNVNEAGNVCDVETGDLTPGQAPIWVQNAHARGVSKPWCYCNLSTKAALFAAMAGAGLVLHQHWEWWSAGYTDGKPRLDPDAVATQYADPIFTGNHYDLSLANITLGGFLGMTPDQEAQFMAFISDLQQNGVAQGQTSFGSTLASLLSTQQQNQNLLRQIAANTTPPAASGVPAAPLDAPGTTA